MKTTPPSVAAATPTALADDHPLSQWVEVFRAGQHTDMTGRTTTFDETALDQMIANHAAQPAPAVIGHPDNNDPAMGWMSALKREGSKLLAKFDQWNPAFVAAVDAGGYRNRSVAVAKRADGWKILHTGFLGAKLPAVEGMAALGYAAGDEVMNFLAPYETCEGQAASALEDVAALMTGLREREIAANGIEAADAALPAWRINGLRESAARLREMANAEAAEDITNPTRSPYSTGEKPMSFSQEDLDRAATEGAAKATADAQAAFAEQGQAAALELAQLKAKFARAEIDAQINTLMGEGRLLPCETAGLAEFMAALPAADTFAFAASADEGAAEMKQSPVQFFAAFLAKRAPVIKLGAWQMSADDLPGADLSPAELADKAQSFLSAQAAQGIEINLVQAIDAVKAGKDRPAKA